MSEIRVFCLHGSGPVIWDPELNPHPRPNDPVFWQKRSAEFYTQQDGNVTRHHLMRSQSDNDFKSLIAEYIEWKRLNAAIVQKCQKTFKRFKAKDENAIALKSNVLTFKRS